MKTLFLTLLLVTQTALAGEVGDKTDVLSAQLRVTSDSLQQVLAKMRNAPGVQETYTNPDFVAAANRFNSLAEAAMIKFENTLRNDILPQITPYLNRLESIKASPAYNDAQKRALLKQQFEVAKVFVSKLSEKYNQAIYQLYVLDLPKIEVDEVLKCPLFDDQGKVFLKITFEDKNVDSPILFHSGRTYCGSSRNSGSTADKFPYARFFSEIRNIVFSKSIKENCASQSCVSLLAIHRATYVYEIHDAIDKTLEFITVTREPLYLGRLDRNIHGSISSYFSSTLNDIQELPFDVTPEEFEKFSKTKGKTNEISYSNPR